MITDITQIVDQQKQQYQILDVIELDDAELSQKLSGVRKDYYTPNEKILIVQHNADVYPYVDAPGQQLSLLQKKCSDLQISNFFVTVITGNPDIENELQEVQKQFSTDDLPMNYIKVNSHYQKNVTKYSDTYCVLPWMHLHVGTTGDVLPCCIADQNRPIGNLLQDDLPDIMFSPDAMQLKQNMIQGYRSKSCSSCYLLEDNDIRSQRQSSNKKYADYISQDTEKFSLIYLDIRINNLCNFKCRMCSEWFSSSIAEETKEIYGKDSRLKYHYIDITALSKNKRKSSFEKIKKVLGHKIQNIYFAGGEPLLAQEHYQLLDYFIDISHTDIEIRYNTNLSKLSFKNRSVLELWKKFSNVYVGASIDCSDEVAEYVRHGTVWSDILKNIQLIKEHCPHVNLNITSTVGFMNAENLINLQKNWIENCFIKPEKFSINLLHSPDYLSLAALPLHHKRRLTQLIEQHCIWCNSIGAESLANRWSDIVKFMNNNDFSMSKNEFQERTNVLDCHRNESFKSVFPQFQDLL